MGRKKTPGLYKRKGVWHIDKQVFGVRICQSTGSCYLEEAEKYLARCIEKIREASVYGVRPKRMFREAATKFLMENHHKVSLGHDAMHLKRLEAFIGDLPLEAVHMGSLRPFIDARKAEGVKSGTINHALQVVRRILNLAAGEWLDEQGVTWLANAPKIKLLPKIDKQEPYPLSWEEQERLFQELPEHLRHMALFAVNTGCRDAVICNLQWAWEVELPDHRGSVFLVPKEAVKNRQDRLVVLNKIAQQVIDSVRGQHPQNVFSYHGKPTLRMLNSAWQKARQRAGLPQVRVHDLKHTFGRRLRAAGVSFEDRQDLLGHKSGRVTTHYSCAELDNLIQAANDVCQSHTNGITLAVLKRSQDFPSSRKSPASAI